MAPPIHTELSSSDSENDAPESISLSQTKKASQQHEKTLRGQQLAEKEKQRARNRKRDRVLKEQALRSSKRRKEKDVDEKGGVEERNGAEARMLRAMQQAEEESEEDEDEGQDGESSEDDEDEEMDEDSEDGEDEDGLNDVEMDQDSESDLEEIRSISVPSRTSNRLPDHVFMSAATPSSSKTPTLSKKSSQIPSKKRNKAKKSPKEAVVGGRTIKVLASADSFPKTSSSMVPSAKIKKFLDHSLSLKGSRSKSRGWERRPVNIGSMRRQGPAANFVRNS
ncbi:hypothetical protein L218DRAFT_930311 [Marasmius fiardii PR-910]|nr:hypothetical protein L218DRAFT_930311 [Marasmius fiardii PR-910]